MSESEIHRILFYGGNGALGSKCVSYFKENKWWVLSIDVTANTEADFNILVNTTESLSEQEENVLDLLKDEMNDTKFDTVICVAGGWTSGNSKNNLAKNTDLMWRQNVSSSVIAATIAAHYLREGGLLIFTGANAALKETPGMISYGLSKAAVHHLTKSLAGNNESLPLDASSGLPYDATCLAILPVILDTPMNRIWMPKSDYSSWTPLGFIAELFWNWSNNCERPSNGSLLQLITKDCVTSVVATN